MNRLLLLLMTFMFMSFRLAYADSEISIVVNNVPITTSAISRRVSLLRLRNIDGNLESIAKEELIDETLQRLEARRINLSIPDNEIEVAYRNFATDNNMAYFELDNLLTESGATIRGFKEYIRSGLRWQRAVGLRYRAENSIEDDNPLSYLFGGEGDEGVETIQYTLKQVIFVVPKDKLETHSDARMTQANNFRSVYRSCAGIIDIAKKFKDVSVLDPGRVSEDRIPPQWRTEVKATSEGKLTRAVRTDRGVELFAVCKKEKLRSSSSEAKSSGFGNLGDDIGKELEEFSKEYNSELRLHATIRKN